jgi:hypothetical protein
MAPDTLAGEVPGASVRSGDAATRSGGAAGGLAPPPWALALAVAIPLAIAYLIVEPPSGDLAAATYRSDVFARVGLTLWDNGWYSGHYLPGYSLLAPALGALAGNRLLLALCTIAAAGLFGEIARQTFSPGAARIAAGSFALGAGVTMLSGRVAFSLGLALGLLAVVALPAETGTLAERGVRAEGECLPTSARGACHPASVGRFSAAVVLAVLTSLASPVAGAFLALAGLAYALAGRTWRGLAIAAAALAPILLLTLAFPEGGWEPFAPSVFWPGLGGVVLIALLLPRVASGLTPRAVRALTWGAWLYALALVGSFALHTAVGSNAARLGELFAAPLVAGVLWERRRNPNSEGPGQPASGWLRHPDPKNEGPGSPAHSWLRHPDPKNEGPGSPAHSWLRHPLVLLALAAALLYWQLETPLNDVSALAGDPSVNASYYAPLLGELEHRAHGTPLRVEVPLTGAHWESAYLPEHGSILLARGWERQLDTRYAALFYAPTLTPAAYRKWLYENAVSYVALPDVRLDFAGEAEGRLIAHGLPYLRQVWRSAHWRLFTVTGAPPLASAPALLTGVGADAFTLAAPRPGSYEVRVRFTPYWALVRGRGCVRSAPGGWTVVEARAAGAIRVGIDFSLARIFDHGPRCD